MKKQQQWNYYRSESESPFFCRRPATSVVDCIMGWELEMKGPQMDVMQQEEEEHHQQKQKRSGSCSISWIKAPLSATRQKSKSSGWERWVSVVGIFTWLYVFLCAVVIKIFLLPIWYQCKAHFRLRHFLCGFPARGWWPLPFESSLFQCWMHAFGVVVFWQGINWVIELRELDDNNFIPELIVSLTGQWEIMGKRQEFMSFGMVFDRPLAAGGRVFYCIEGGAVGYLCWRDNRVVGCRTSNIIIPSDIMN